jgi:hypothetical protein
MTPARISFRVTPAFNHTVRLLVVFLYAMAMAWVEAAVVFYLRTMVNRIEPYQPNPLPIFGGLGRAELVREAATLVMLLTVGILAGRTWRSRLGYGALAFGVWDIFYYVFLKNLCGWPHSLFDWDILFLLPLPWWGPVLAPVSIAALMILWGTLASHSEVRSLSAPHRVFHGDAEPNTSKAGWKPALLWLLTLSGVMLALYVFMADSISVAGQGSTTLRNVLPTRFNWPLFTLALVLMAAPMPRLIFLQLQTFAVNYRPETASAASKCLLLP